MINSTKFVVNNSKVHLFLLSEKCLCKAFLIVLLLLKLYFRKASVILKDFYKSIRLNCF